MPTGFSKKLATFWLATAVLIALPCLAAAQDDLHVSDSSLNAAESLTVGDEFTYNVEVEHPAEHDLELTSPPEGSRWSELDRSLETTTSGDSATTRATVEYAIFRPGPTTGPPVEFVVSGESIAVEAPRKELHVSAVTDKDAALADPRSPWPLWSDRPMVLWYAAGVLGVGLFAFAGALLIRRRRRAEALIYDPPPHEVALRALERLAGDFPNTTDGFKPFYFRLSHILRRYLGDRFGFPGAELTTTEMIERLRSVDHPALDVQAMARWLRACDRVKFAGYIPGEDKTREQLEYAIGAVETTAPDPEDEGQESDDTTREVTS